jgi:predicted Zn-ribbon and HTH transcriptional regulator
VKLIDEKNIVNECKKCGYMFLSQEKKIETCPKCKRKVYEIIKK